MPTDRIRSLAFASLAGALTVIPFSNSLFEILSGLYLGTTLWVLLREKRWDDLKSPLAALAAAYLFIALLSCFGSPYVDNSLKGIFRVLRSVLMCVFVMVTVDSRERFKTLYFIMAGVSLLIGVDALMQGWLGFDPLRGMKIMTFTMEDSRVTGPFHHANDFSAYLSLVIFLFLGLFPFFLKKGDRKGIFLVVSGAALLGVCLLWTYGRGAWLAVTLSFIVMAFFKRSRLLIGILAAAAALVFALSPQAIHGRIASLWNPKDGTMIERRLLWQESLDMIHERPWLGYGINSYSKVEPQFKSKTVQTDYQYAHNGYLQIGAETGLLGLGAFLSLLLYFLTVTGRGLWGRQEEFTAAAASSLLYGILAFLMHSATDTDLQSLRLVSLLWLSLGLVIAAKKIVERTAP